MDHVLCPHCGRTIQRDPKLAGHAVACPDCNGQFVMPTAEPLPAAEPTPPPVVVGPDRSSPPRPTPRRRPPADDSSRLIIAGVALTVVLLALIGVGVVVAINRSAGDRGGAATARNIPAKGNPSTADRRSGGTSSGSSELGDPARPLPPLDELIGRPFPASHPDADERIAEAGRRRISVAQSGNTVRIGDVEASDSTMGEYGGFVFGFKKERDGPLLLVTASGDEPLRIPRSFQADQGIVERFLKQHHGRVQVERSTEAPYYQAHLAVEGEGFVDSGVQHGRTREEIQRSIDEVFGPLRDVRVTIHRLERIGSVVFVEYRAGGSANGVRSEEEFLVLNGQVVYRFASGRSAVLSGD